MIAMQGSLLRNAVRVSAGLVIGAALCGCTVLMTEPARPEVTKRAAGLSFEEALSYWQSAFTNMTAARDQVDHLNVATKGAVGLGVGGAAITALTKGSSDVVLGLLTLGGTGYALNETSNLTVQSAIYKAGLDSLDCIERTGSRVHRETGSARAELRAKQVPLQRAIAAVAADVSEARGKVPMEEGMPQLVPEAERALAAARELQRSVRDFINATDVGAEMYYSVNKTVSAVNGQLRARAPSLDEIVKAGSTLTGFVSANSKVGTDAVAARAAARTPAAVAQARHAQSVDRLMADLRHLHDVIAEIQAILPPAGYAKSDLVDSCQALLPGQGVFRVTPSGPITLVPGGEAHQLTVEADLLPLSHGFHGAVPTAQQVVVSHPSDRVFMLAAPAGAKPNRYQFFIAQKDGRMLGDIEVSVGAASNGSERSNSPGPKPRTGMTLAAKRALIGLGEDVKAETDAAFINRVKKLDNCFGITPSDGILRDKLVAELGKRERVNLAGDCPAVKKAATAGTVPPTAGTPANTNQLPIPATPPIKPASS